MWALVVAGACAGAASRRFHEYEGSDAARCFVDRGKTEPSGSGRLLGFSGLDAIRAIEAKTSAADTIEWLELDGAADNVLSSHRSIALSVISAPETVTVIGRKTRRTIACRYARYMLFQIRVRISDADQMFTLEGDLTAYVASATEWFVWGSRPDSPLTGTASPELLTVVAADMGLSDPRGIGVYGYLNDGRLTIFARSEAPPANRWFAAGQWPR